MLMFIFKCVKGFDFYRELASRIHFYDIINDQYNAMKLSVYISLRYIWMNTQGILDFFLLKYSLYLQNFTRYKCLNIVVRTISRGNRPRLFHALVEIRRVGVRRACAYLTPRSRDRFQ